MTLLPTLAFAFAAFCVWLTVRIINRWERWAKWTLAGMLVLPLLYVTSFGFAIRAYHRDPAHASYATIVKAYRPLLVVVGRSPSGIRWAVEQFVRLWLPSDHNFGIHTDDSGDFGIWPTEFD
jgi:hypothetical protein